MTDLSDCALSLTLLTSWFMNMFLTVSGPIKAILASFNVSVSHLLRRRLGKTRLCYASRIKSSKNYLHCPSIAPKLRLSLDQRFPFLENVNLFPNIKSWPQDDEKCGKKILPWPFLGLVLHRTVATDGRCSWLSGHAARSKSPPRSRKA